MKQSLKELINEIDTPIDGGLRYKNDIAHFIEEAKKGGNWTQWDDKVFEQYFEKNLNVVAKLGNGQMSRKEKASVKEHWMELAPHLKAIAESQVVPLWNEYKIIRDIIKKYTNRNLNVATNRMLAGLQPKLLCTECDITRINMLVDYLRRYTDETLPNHDPLKWEVASHNLNNLFKRVSTNKDYWNLYYISYKLLRICKKKFDILPKRWLAYANSKMFRHADALHEIGFICWTMHKTPFSIGDEVYLFMSDERRIMFKTKVVADNYVRKDLEYCLDGGDTDNLTYKLDLVVESMSDELKEENLKAHGFNGGQSIKKPMHNNPELFEYITHFFIDNIIIEYDEIPNPETVYEGAKKEIIVNRYERNHEAREKCIAAHGCKCAVCGMDFEKTYGKIGRGFIHVHHIVPLSSIGKEYELDPIKHLVPVCPNCHAMLHRKDPPYKVEKLKELGQF